MTGRVVLGAFLFIVVLFGLVFFVNNKVKGEDFNGYFKVDLTGRWSLSEDEKAVLRPYVEKRLTEFKENWLVATNAKVKWANELHPDKTAAEALDALKGREIIEEAHRQTFRAACNIAIHWGVVEKCDYNGAN